MNPVDDLLAYLEGKGFAGGVSGWDILKRRDMDSPAGDRLIVLTEDAGPAPEMATSAGIGDSALGDLGVQVMVRAEAWEASVTRAKADAIFSDLHGRLAFTINGTKYMRVRALSSQPLFLGYDDRGRPRHAITFNLLAAVAPPA